MFLILLISHSAFVSLSIVKKGFSYQSSNTALAQLSQAADGIQGLDGAKNHRIYSPSGKYALAMQNDGGLVLYSIAPLNGLPKDNSLWSASYANDNYPRQNLPFQAIVQPDGQFIVYNNKGAAVWGSNTWRQGTNTYYLKLQDDGNLVLYDSNGGSLWSTNTSGKV